MSWNGAALTWFPAKDNVMANYAAVSEAMEQAVEKTALLRSVVKKRALTTAALLGPQLTYDPIPHDTLVDPEVRFEAHGLHSMVGDVTDRDSHTDAGVFLALAVAYLEQAELMAVDPVDALLQIMDAYPSFDLNAD